MPGRPNTILRLRSLSSPALSLAEPTAGHLVHEKF